MCFSVDVESRLLTLLRELYGDRAEECMRRIEDLVAGLNYLPPLESGHAWSERDIVLIAYPDQIHSAAERPLAALRRFLLRHGLDRLASALHLLPFFPSSSDEGFAITDYRQVDPQFGSWQDIDALAESFDLMFDLVLNHCSSRHPWFRGCLEGRAPYPGYFITADPGADLHRVPRPRSLPLLTPLPTAGGTRYFWTTFSADQVDLNWANPNVLVEMLGVLFLYLTQGAWIIRLDAIAYLWKQIGASCIHLPQTHAVVRVIRLLMDVVAPGSIVLTETNVPHAENVSYFGKGDEAHLVYQFSLPPLLLEAFVSGDARCLSGWLAELQPTGKDAAFLNFTASHDGIGVRPLEGILPPQRIDRLVSAVRCGGGRVGMRRTADGGDAPYELNATWFSALGEAPEEQQLRRFLATQAVMLALKGIPAVYFQSVLGSPNDEEAVVRSGSNRAINRQRFDLAELDAMLDDERSMRRRIFDGYRRLLAVRIAQPAFHPDAPQKVLDFGNPAVVAFLRTSLDGRQEILVAANVSENPVSIDFGRYASKPFVVDLLEGVAVEPGTFRATLEGGQCAWLSRA